METQQPANIADLARRALAALGQDQIALAEELLLRLVAIDPDEPGHAAHLATLYQRLGKHGLAIAFAQRAAALDPEDARFARQLGSTLEAGGEPDLAHQAYLAAVAGNPGHPQPWLALARLDREGGRLETAERYARRAVETAPRATDGYGELARVLLRAGRPTQALAALAIGLRLAPDDPDLRALREAASAQHPEAGAPTPGPP
ncbi:MAG TPA: tetratricopeptide repeat protein [Chloroflexota bacterium]|jgi:tetratricopeptide (TPR) repeat protein